MYLKGLDGTVVDLEMETGWNWRANMTVRPDVERVCIRAPLGGISTIFGDSANQLQYHLLY